MSIQITSICKADTICFSATELLPNFVAVESSIHSGGKVSLGIVQGGWMINFNHLQESVDWTPVKDACNNVYTRQG